MMGSQKRIRNFSLMLSWMRNWSTQRNVNAFILLSYEENIFIVESLACDQHKRDHKLSNITLKIVVSGLVQGVGFRYFTRQQAQRLGLKGRATNLADGRVEVVVEGSEEVVVKMLDWLKSGPSSARVEHLVCQPCPEESGTFPDFRAY